VVGHQAESVDDPASFSHHAAHDIQELPAIPIVEKRPHPRHTARHHMVESTIKLNS
jgi:hypothetical protein